ncbi:MAG TPA: ATP-binding protein [Polyangiaceae bacterium]|nr:ATP-binding protein [Polyangiaceae bacterium]
MASTLPSPNEVLSPEQSLARERAILQYVVDNVPYCIFWKDKESRYLGCNKNFAALDGCSDPRELVGKTDYDMAWREHAEGYRRFDRATMERGEPLLNQEEVTHDDRGREMVILTSKVPLRNESGDVIGLLGIIVDITERKRIETELQAAKEEAERAARIKGEFLANISHELRTPLTLVASPLESLLAGDAGPLPRAVLSQIERAHRNALRLVGMVNDLLDFSRLDAGKQRVVREHTDVAQLAALIVSDAQPLAGARGLMLEFASDLEQEPLSIDRGMFEKILMNLLGNALEFTPRGGRVDVLLRPQGEHFELTVRDTGIGIAAVDHERIFERFQQGDPTSTRQYGGTGLGLALVKEFAELMGGRVSVESEPGQGARFSVLLPRQPGNRAGATTPLQTLEVLRWSTMQQAPGDTLPPDAELSEEALPSLVLAEDNAEMRTYLRQLLAGRYRVVAVDNGRAALEAARQELPDVILSDVMMPGLDGLTLVEILKSDEALRHIPVVLLTARAAKDAAVTALEAGADDYICKPFSPEELRARLRATYRLGHAVRRMAQLEKDLAHAREQLSGERSERRASEAAK